MKEQKIYIIEFRRDPQLLPMQKKRICCTDMSIKDEFVYFSDEMGNIGFVTTARAILYIERE